MPYIPGNKPDRSDPDYIDHALYESSDVKLAVTVRHRRQKIRLAAFSVVALVVLAVLHHWLWIVLAAVPVFTIWMDRYFISLIRDELAMRHGAPRTETDR